MLLLSQETGSALVLPPAYAAGLTPQEIIVALARGGLTYEVHARVVPPQMTRTSLVMVRTVTRGDWQQLLLNSDIEETQGQALFDALHRGLTHFARNRPPSTPPTAT